MKLRRSFPFFQVADAGGGAAQSAAPNQAPRYDFKLGDKAVVLTHEEMTQRLLDLEAKNAALAAAQSNLSKREELLNKVKVGLGSQDVNAMRDVMRGVLGYDEARIEQEINKIENARRAFSRPQEEDNDLDNYETQPRNKPSRYSREELADKIAQLKKNNPTDWADLSPQMKEYLTKLGNLVGGSFTRELHGDIDRALASDPIAGKIIKGGLKTAVEDIVRQARAAAKSEVESRGADSALAVKAAVAKAREIITNYGLDQRSDGDQSGLAAIAQMLGFSELVAPASPDQVKVPSIRSDNFESELGSLLVAAGADDFKFPT